MTHDVAVAAAGAFVCWVGMAWGWYWRGRVDRDA